MLFTDTCPSSDDGGNNNVSPIYSVDGPFLTHSDRLISTRYYASLLSLLTLLAMHNMISSLVF